MAYLSLEKYEHFLLPDRVSIAQWSEHWYIKPEALRPISAVSRGQLDNVWYSAVIWPHMNLFDILYAAEGQPEPICPPWHGTACWNVDKIILLV